MLICAVVLADYLPSFFLASLSLSFLIWGSIKTPLSTSGKLDLGGSLDERLKEAYILA